jgi:hypothetical protein
MGGTLASVGTTDMSPLLLGSQCNQWRLVKQGLRLASPLPATSAIKDGAKVEVIHRKFI